MMLTDKWSVSSSSTCPVKRVPLLVRWRAATSLKARIKQNTLWFPLRFSFASLSRINSRDRNYSSRGAQTGPLKEIILFLLLHLIFDEHLDAEKTWQTYLFALSTIYCSYYWFMCMLHNVCCSLGIHCSSAASCLGIYRPQRNVVAWIHALKNLQKIEEKK